MAKNRHLQSILNFSVLLILIRPSVSLAQCAELEIIPSNIEISLLAEKGEGRRRLTITEPISKINRMADIYTNQPDTKIGKYNAHCAIRAMLKAANNNSLSYAPNNQSYLFKSWMLASISLSAIKLSPEFTNQQDKKIIADWLALNALDIENYYTKRMNNGLVDNQTLWGGMATMAAGVFSEKSNLIKSARKFRAVALDAVLENGIFPIELTRHGKSLHYHAFSAVAVVGMFSIDPIKPSRFEIDKLARLISLVLNDCKKLGGGTIASMTGTYQHRPDKIVILNILKMYQNIDKKNELKPSDYGDNKNYMFLSGDISFIVDLLKKRFCSRCY